jgi:hypothetical protein
MECIEVSPAHIESVLAPVAGRFSTTYTEILVDTYDEYEEAAAWHCYLEDRLSTPFRAVCTKTVDIFPLIKGDEVTARRMADLEVCIAGGSMYLMVEWNERTFAMPLDQFDPVGSDEDTAEAVEDWKYWWGQKALSGI